ncbi:hypothetical protein GCM10010273_20130 [Streptomyces lavendulocolor]
MRGAAPIHRFGGTRAGTGRGRRYGRAVGCGRTGTGPAPGAGPHPVCTAVTPPPPRVPPRPLLRPARFSAVP